MPKRHQLHEGSPAASNRPSSQRKSSDCGGGSAPSCVDGSGLEPDEGSQAERPESASHGEGKRRSHKKESAISILTKIVQHKNAKLQSVMKQKKLLQQTIRRQARRIKHLQDALSLAKDKSKPKSLDVTRVADDGDVQGKSRSWFTPAGAISLAVTCQSESIGSCNCE